MILSNSDFKSRNKFGGIRLMNYYYMSRKVIGQFQSYSFPLGFALWKSMEVYVKQNIYHFLDFYFLRQFCITVNFPLRRTTFSEFHRFRKLCFYFLCLQLSSDFFFDFFIDPLVFVVVVLTSLVSQMVKRLPTVWETRYQLQGREDLLEKGMVTHSSILAQLHGPKRGSKKYLGFPGGSEVKTSAWNAETRVFTSMLFSILMLSFFPSIFLLVIHIQFLKSLV